MCSGCVNSSARGIEHDARSSAEYGLGLEEALACTFGISVLIAV